MSIHLILYCLIILTYQCSNLVENKLFITSTQNETIKIPLSQLFISSDYSKITFKPVVKQFTIANLLQEIEKVSNHKVNGSTISIKMFKSTTSCEPQHQMAILRYYEGIYYSEYDLINYSTFPNLAAVYPSTGKRNSKCFDIVLMNTIIITECSDDEGDYFSIQKINQSTYNYLTIQKPKDAFRKLDMIDKYLLRGNVDKLELYQEKEQTLEFLDILDSAALRILLNQKYFLLEIRDFQTHTNGQISILNASGELIVLQYFNNQWQLIKTIDTKISTVYSYDFDIYLDTYVILSKQYLYYKAITNQEFIVNVDSKPFDKVFLQKSSILLVQDKILSLYSQQLYKSYSTTFFNSKYLINSFPSQDGFLIIDDEYFYKYAINSEYSIQFSADSLPIEKDYQMIKILQSADCVIEIYYMVVNFESTEIYSSQAPKALIASGIFQDNLEVKFKPIFEGSNLQYEFNEQNILNLKVEQYQGIEILNVGEIENVIYRKSLSNLNNPYIQIIQQHSNSQISGYTCEELLSQLKLKCQPIFTKRQFDQLQDSDKQLWWFNYDSIFLAILKDSTITIYCVFYNQNKFDLLTTINLDSNAQKIATDGNYLFVQCQQSIQIYTVSVNNKAILIQNKNIDGDIYASPGQQNLLFIDLLGQLKIYSLNQGKFSMIWFTEISDIYEKKNLVIFRNRFAKLIKTKNEEKYLAIVYNIQNLNNIYFEKHIKLNNNSSLKLTQIEVNLQQSLFFIVVNNNEKYNLQGYKIDDTSYNSKFINLYYTSTAQFSITNQYCFITDSIENKLVQKNYYITGDQFVQSTLKEGYQQIQYSKEISLTVQIKNDFQRVITQIIPALVVNRGVSIFQTKNFFDLKYKADGTQNHCINLEQSWYSGQVFDIIQNQSEKLQYIKTLSKEIETLEFSPFIQELNSDQLVQLMENKIILVQKSDLTKKEFNLDETYKIKQLLIIINQLIYVEVQKGDLNYLKIIACIDSDCKLLDDELTLTTRINKVYLHDNNFFIYSFPDIQVYDTKGDPIKLSAFEQFYKFTLFTQPFYLEFYHLHNNVYSAISVDIRGNTYFNNLEISETSKENQIFAQNVINILKLNNLYVNINSICVGLNLRKNDIIIVYNNIPTFAFKFDFDCTKKKLCDLKSFELNGIFQQYGEWTIFNLYPIIYSNENILSLVYWAQTHFELLLFDLQTVSSKENPNLAIAHLITPQSKIPGEFHQVQSFVYRQNEQLHLLASTDNYDRLTHYRLKRQSQICTSAYSVNDRINLTLSNSFSKININLNITIQEDNQIPPNPSNDDEDKQSFPIWIIILITLGILMIGIVIFYWWKKSQIKVEEEEMLLA
ncbi:unnamed protein product [Paramecium sonneborni]|uniref:Transmembrane protein n=1 Tax=Paramecium sonneborni TaxID=65129 RepID=A0A8S1KCH0_9CILI|nr:unnamed protein product [Paramecium sonneborni]